MKKLRLSALTALFLSFSLIGCSQSLKTDRPETDQAATAGSVPALTTPSYYNPNPPAANQSYTPERQLALLADRDFGGIIFLVIQEKGLDNAIFPSSDELSEAYADRRNRLVQEKYNVEIGCIEMTREEIITELSRSKIRGDYFCDMLVVSPSLLTELKEQGLLLALDTLPFFEDDSVCIRQDATAEINSRWNSIYGIWGDALRQPSRAYAVYYNTALAADNGCPNFYAAVQSGSWDWETLKTYATEGKLLFDGSLSTLLFATAGVNSATDEGAKLPTDSEFLALQASLEASLLAPTEDESAKDAFLAGKSLFYIGDLGDLGDFTHTEVQVGLLPLPKYDASAEDYPYLVDQSVLPILACPINVTSAAGTGMMLSALNAASCDEVEELFLQSAETKVRDNGSSIMLNYCIGSLAFDRKLIYGE